MKSWPYLCFTLLLCVFSLQACIDKVPRACEKDTDCKDSKPEIYCFKGFCSEQACSPGDTKTCYEGKPGTQDKGTCKPGKKLCAKNGLWSSCFEQILPREEICDQEDNNCDGKTDEGLNCKCQPGKKQKCYSGPANGLGKGPCHAGTQFCGQNARWEKCLEQGLPEKEICDQKDNNCDGQVDESQECICTPGESQACYTGPIDVQFENTPCQQGKQFCNNKRQWSACLGAVQPGPELCDSKDNDCDGEVDEACKPIGAGPNSCKPGDNRFCYPKDAKEVLKGICRTGVQICSKDGKWQECKGFVPKKDEVCDGEDNDCDGEIDEGCPQSCKNGEKRPCYTGPTGTKDKGPCKAGTQVCAAGRWSQCAADLKPTVEICDNIDNDCDGQVDEDIRRICKTVCEVGTQSCSKGKWQTCDARKPIAEMCDGKDNDCDGVIDESLKKECSTKCGKGQAICYLGQWQNCSAPAPKAEVCDGKDNNCDGQVDEKVTKSCSTPCGAGLETCKKGKWESCDAPKPKTEICNGKDDDCDSQVDEGCGGTCTTGTTRSCYNGPSGTKGKGLCKAGTQKCVAKKWGACTGDIVPSAEICDNKDNNCNGQTDEGGILLSCSTACGTGNRTCLLGQWGLCTAPKPEKETCNNKDDNCNGQTDENLTKSCSSTCETGQEICIAGKWRNCSARKPQPEVCDGKDNNCDGKIDENLTQSCSTTCGTGKEFCLGSTWKNCSAPAPKAEVCDGKDNNCNGQTDEGKLCKTNETCIAGSCVPNGRPGEMHVEVPQPPKEEPSPDEPTQPDENITPDDPPQPDEYIPDDGGPPEPEQPEPDVPEPDFPEPDTPDPDISNGPDIPEGPGPIPGPTPPRQNSQQLSEGQMYIGNGTLTPIFSRKKRSSRAKLRSPSKQKDSKRRLSRKAILRRQQRSKRKRHVDSEDREDD